LREDGFAVRTSFTAPDRLTAQDVAGPARAVIAIGGDGTLRAVLGRLLVLRGDVPPVLAVPLGTANLMVRHLGFRWADEALEKVASVAIRNLHVRLLDAGLANGRLFLVMAGAGFDAQIVHELDRLRRGPISVLSYVLPAAIALRDFAFSAMRVCVDGREVFANRPAMAFVGNIREYGAGFPVLPYARPDDGLLDVCVLPCGSKMELIRLFLQAAAGEHTLSPDAVYVRARENVRIDSEAPVPVQVDGDPAGTTPVEFTLLPVRVPFIVPR